MRTYYYINSTTPESFEHIFRLLWRTGSRQVFNLDGEVFKTLGESTEVLISKDGCRHENCHLFIIDTSLESRSDSHFRLTEAHVAADKAVHRPLPFHIGLDVLCRL